MNKEAACWVGRLALGFAVSMVMIAPALAVQADVGLSTATYTQAHKATPVIAATGVPVTVQPMSGSTRVYIARTGTKYHRSGCRYVKRSRIAKTLRWVKAHHYGACKVCKPPTR